MPNNRATVSIMVAATTAIAVVTGDANAQGSFNGPYVGAAIGYGISELNTEKTTFLPPDSEIGSSVRGVAGTAFAGYNHAVGHHLYLGVEADATWSHWTGSFHNDDYEVDWNASIRARLAYELRPDLLAYVTGGIGWMHASVSPNHTGDFSKTLTGYVVGGGLEHVMHSQVRLRLEYLYSNYRSWEFDPTPIVHEKTDPDMHQIRIGIVIPLQHARAEPGSLK